MRVPVNLYLVSRSSSRQVHLKTCHTCWPHSKSASDLHLVQELHQSLHQLELERSYIPNPPPFTKLIILAPIRVDCWDAQPGDPYRVGIIHVSLQAAAPHNAICPIAVCDANLVGIVALDTIRPRCIVCRVTSSDANRVGIVALDTIRPRCIVGRVTSSDADGVGVVTFGPRGVFRSFAASNADRVPVFDRHRISAVVGMGKGRGYGQSNGESRARGDQERGFGEDHVCKFKP